MNKKALKTLEYDKIIDLLAARATSPLGAELCRSLTPLEDLETIRRRQQETGDALSRLFQKGSISFGSARDLKPSLGRLALGSSLNQSELLAIAGLLENTARVKSYGRRERADAPADSLEELFDLLEPLTPLSAEIRRCILSEEEISDDASPALRHVRRSIRLNGERIHSQLNSLMNGSLRTYLQDAVITMRSGRYCLPVKSEYRSQVPGMIHDQSSTGATVFIEPMAVVKLNNEIRELELQEEKEIEAVLASLSASAAEHLEALQYNLENMAELDFIFARASLAMDMNATKPEFNEAGRIHLRQARHPLIQKTGSSH